MIREHVGAVAVLSLNRPKAYNALNREVFDALGAHLATCKDDDAVRAVIITGSSKAFCAGADINAFDALRAESILGSFDAGGGPTWEVLNACRKPVIAAVEGVAFGGGCELALACDTVIAGAGARFAVPEVKLGVIPGAGGTQRLIRAVGKAKAMAMLLSGDPLDAAAAEAAGLVAAVAPAGEALTAALALAGRIAANSPLAVALAKDAARVSMESPLAHGLEYERRNFAVALRSDDCHEGQRAFEEKRTPNSTESDLT